MSTESVKSLPAARRVICEIFAQKNYRTYKSATQRTHNK